MQCMQLLAFVAVIWKQLLCRGRHLLSDTFFFSFFFQVHAALTWLLTSTLPVLYCTVLGPVGSKIYTT